SLHVRSSVSVEVVNNRIIQSVGTAEDGSRIYFTSNHRLLRGAPAGRGTYRLDVASGDLAYVGTSQYLTTLGSERAMSHDGSVVVFATREPRFNAITGQQNGGTLQYYRYDDNDRSLICISCPSDGSTKTDLAVDSRLVLDASGDTFAFSTPAPLVS